MEQPLKIDDILEELERRIQEGPTANPPLRDVPTELLHRYGDLLLKGAAVRGLADIYVTLQDLERKVRRP